MSLHAARAASSCERANSLNVCDATAANIICAEQNRTEQNRALLSIYTHTHIIKQHRIRTLALTYTHKANLQASLHFDSLFYYDGFFFISFHYSMRFLLFFLFFAQEELVLNSNILK